MNEPLYFDTEPDRTKKDVVEIVTHWKNLLSQYSHTQIVRVFKGFLALKLL